jgi:hypothetical protein
MKRTAVSYLLMGILVLEVAIPAIGLTTSTPPRKYSWSMYVHSSTAYQYVGVKNDGQSIVLDPAEVGSPWKDIHYGSRTIKLLCEKHPGLYSITRNYDGNYERSQKC